MKRKILLTISSFFFLILLGFGVAWAAEVNINFPVNPALGLGEPADTSTITGYIIRLYQFGVSIAGILAVGMIVAGAIYRSVSAGSPDKISEGNNMITSALWGLLLLLGSYIILRTINPQLVNLRAPVAPRVSIPTSTPIGIAAGAALCPNPTNTGCFFNPSRPSSTAACDFQDPDARCTAIDRSTNMCEALASQNIEAVAGVCTNKPNPQVTAERILQYIQGCVCPDCQPIPVGNDVDHGQIPVKATACSTREINGRTVQGSTLGACFLNSRTMDMVKRFIRNLKDASVELGTSPGQWRITEAFPPGACHSSPTHYNGKTFDFAPDGGVSPYACNQAMKVAQIASQVGFDVILIEGGTSSTPVCANIPRNPFPRVTKTANGAPFHFHIENLRP